MIYFFVILICIFHITNAFESPFLLATVDAWYTSQIPPLRPRPMLAQLPGVLAARNPSQQFPSAKRSRFTQGYEPPLWAAAIQWILNAGR